MALWNTKSSTNQCIRKSHITSKSHYPISSCFPDVSLICIASGNWRELLDVAMSLSRDALTATVTPCWVNGPTDSKSISVTFEVFHGNYSLSCQWLFWPADQVSGQRCILIIAQCTVYNPECINICLQMCLRDVKVVWMAYVSSQSCAAG